MESEFGGVRVGFWSPVFCRAGGTETWHSTLIQGLSVDLRTTVTGLGVLDSECDPVSAAEIGQYCPVRVGVDGMRQVAAESDVVVFWGLAHPEVILEGMDRPHMIGVAHGDHASKWTASVLLHASGVADRFVAVSNAAMACIPEQFRASATVIENGVDVARMLPAMGHEEQRRLWGVPPGAKVVGVLGRMSDEKNPRALAECVAALPPEWVGVHVGDGPDMADTIAHAFAVAGTRVFHPGVTLDVGSALNAFDVLLCPSHTEGFGYAIVEGWLANIPVVSTPVGIAPENARHTFLLQANPSGPEMAAMVQRVYEYTHAHPYIMNAAFLMACQRYSAKAFCDRWAEYLERINGELATSHATATC